MGQIHVKLQCYKGICVSQVKQETFTIINTLGDHDTSPIVIWFSNKNKSDENSYQVYRVQRTAVSLNIFKLIFSLSFNCYLLTVYMRGTLKGWQQYLNPWLSRIRVKQISFGVRYNFSLSKHNAFWTVITGLSLICNNCIKSPGDKQRKASPSISCQLTKKTQTLQFEIV